MPGLFDGTPLQRPVTCEHCGKPLAAAAAPPGDTDACACPRDAAGDVKLPRHQHPRVRREKRRGNWCTIVADLDPRATDLKALLKSLRTDLGAGGGLAGEPGSPELLIQGDHRDAVVARLRELGYHAKAAGG
jgi:translation initiation factor 1